MIIMAKNRYPATSAKDFLDKAMVELRDNPYPEFIKRTYYFKFSEGGIVLYIIYEIDPGNEEAAMKDLNARAFKFMQEVEGFEQVSVEILMGIQEAITIMQEGGLPTTSRIKASGNCGGDGDEKD
jgi:hypothetical protein